LGVSVPVSGGGYFRLYPVQLSANWLGRINTQHNQPFLFYVHPWELDPDQPRIACSTGTRFRHYLNLASTERKLHHLLKRFAFAGLSDVLDQRGVANADPTPS
jgi:hypothetical protein